MKQRVIIVPKDKNAEQALDYDKAVKEQLIEFYLNEEEFELLYRKGVFKLINHTCSVNIDDYEEDCVVGEENMGNVIKILKLKKHSLDNNYDQLVEKIIRLFEEALASGTGVYFYF